MPLPGLARSAIASLWLVAGIGLFAGARLLAAPIAGARFNQIEQTVAEELQAGRITGVSIALVDDQKIIYANGFGLADKRHQVRARADTVYRCGSISKLFTAVAAMQLVEAGRLNIDQPVDRVLPQFRLVNPFPDPRPVTLRQLMCHRGGLVREAPVGGYFDDSEPTADQTIASLAACVLVYPPGSRTKYSNSGVTIVGCAVEAISGEPFVTYQKRHLLEPLKMNSSGFKREAPWQRQLATGYLPVADGRGGFREQEAPVFDFGILPAGNLYTTVEDLGRFLSFLFAHGQANGQVLLRAETLAEMFTPQLTSETNGFGLGFNINQFQSHKSVNHMGAVYGFTSLISGLPEKKLGVVVLCNDDIAGGPVRKLGALGLSLLLGEKEEPAPAKPAVVLSPSELSACAGDYESESYWAEVRVENQMLRANISGQRLALSPRGALRFEANGRLVHEGVLTFEQDDRGQVKGFSALGQKFVRVNPAQGADIPAAWRKFLGSYGPAFIPLIVSAKHGHLYAMTENEYDNRLWPLNQTVFKMPPGLYTDEQLVFQIGENGRVHSVTLANMTLKRRKR